MLEDKVELWCPLTFSEEGCVEAGGGAVVDSLLPCKGLCLRGDRKGLANVEREGVNRWERGGGRLPAVLVEMHDLLVRVSAE